MPLHSAQHVGSATVCTMLGVDRSTLIRWVQAGQITPTFKLPGSNGAYVYDRSDIERLRHELQQVRAAAVGAAS